MYRPNRLRRIQLVLAEAFPSSRVALEPTDNTNQVALLVGGVVAWRADPRTTSLMGAGTAEGAVDAVRRFLAEGEAGWGEQQGANGGKQRAGRADSDATTTALPAAMPVASSNEPSALYPSLQALYRYWYPTLSPGAEIYALYPGVCFADVR